MLLDACTFVPARRAMGQANNYCKTLTKAPNEALAVKPMGSEPLPDALISDISHMLHKERVREMSRKILAPTIVEDPAWIVHEEEAQPPPVLPLVERFDGRGTEPFELFRSEFGQNSVKTQELLLENSKNS